MMKNLSIQQRILFTFMVIVLFASVLQLLIAGYQIQVATLKFYQNDLENDALMIASNLSEPLEHFLEGEDQDDLQRLLLNLDSDTANDYILLNPRYQVISPTLDSRINDSDITFSQQVAAEIQSPGVTSVIRADDNGVEKHHAMLPVLYEQRTMGYLFLLRPLQPAYTEIYQEWIRLGSATLPVIILVGLAGIWLSRTISQPLQQLRNSALQMAEGALDTRIDNDAGDEVGQLAQTFNYMAEQVEQLLQAQRSFVSNAAHELRTPLMTLKLRVEALEDDMLPLQERAIYLAELHQEINHMSELVSSLLILARIDEGRHKQQGVIQDTSLVLQDIARHWRIAVQKTNLTFEAQIPEILPEVHLTANDIRLILDNLLGNAIKYTPEGQVILSAKHIADTLCIEVVDTGIGFDATQRAYLLTRFYRTDKARAEFDGNGLGLSIVQAILNQYGADIEATSAGQGRGATFTVSIPLSIK